MSNQTTKGKKGQAKIEGIKDLLDKLDKLENVGEKIKDTVGRECAEEMVEILKKSAPVDKDNKGVHGKEYIKIHDIRTGYKGGSFYIDVGLKGKEFDKWRGIYFHNYLTDSRHYGWLSTAFKTNRANMRYKMRKRISDELKKHL